VKVQRQLQKLEVMNQERELQALEFEAEATGLWSLFHFLAEHEFRVTTEETPVKTPVKTPVETSVKTPIKTPVKTPVETLVETPVKTQVEKRKRRNKLPT